MFQFTEFAFPFGNNMSSTCWVAPFGYRRITSYLHLPDAFRSLSRPSSPLRATGIPRAPLLTFFSRYLTRVFLFSSLCQRTFAPLRGLADNQASSLSAYAALSNRLIFRTVVENKGVEPLTSRMQI